MRIYVFVTTARKYLDNKSEKGQWLCLNNYANYQNFIKECKSIHSDELEPELLFLNPDAPDFLLKMKLITREVINPSIFRFINQNDSCIKA